MNSLPIRIATRESPLALWQAEYVATELQKHGYATMLVPLLSSGDVDLTPIDGKRQIGVFTKRIQQALVDGEADIAVHSLKDLPTAVDSRFTLAAVPPRESVADCLVSDSFDSIEALPEKAVVGTGSTRRIAQLKSLRPDVNVVPIRGNVQTRLNKLDEGHLDALILAHAGLLRLGLTERATSVLPLQAMLPAPGQGALGIEVRSDDVLTSSALAFLDHWPTRSAVIAERTVLAALHGGCLAPIAAHAFWTDGDTGPESDSFTLTALVLSTDGKSRLVETERRSIDREISVRERLDIAIEVGRTIAERLVASGASELISGARLDLNVPSHND